MMNVRKEIDNHASEEDRPILHWLLDHYSSEHKWRFVAACTFQRYGTYSYQVHRIWRPTTEGRALYDALRAA